MANVKLILLEDVESLGLAGTKVTVSPGYARNYLLPRGKAMPVTAAAERMIEARKEKIEAKRREVIAQAQALADQIANTEVSIIMEASADDHLFGSVTARMIADLLAEKGTKVSHTRIQLLEPIKKLGTFPVIVKLDGNLTATITVEIKHA